MTDSNSQPVRATRRALRDSVYEILLERVLSGAYPAGSSLGIDSLARELEVSPTPVREALVQLENTGLASRIALKGYRVAEEMTVEELRELFDMRMILELAGAQRAATKSCEILPAMTQAHHDHIAAAERIRNPQPDLSELDAFEDLRHYFQADWNFHHIYLKASGNRFLLNTGESLRAHVHRLRQTTLRGVHDIDLALEEHGKILRAFEAGDQDEIVESVRSHLAGVAHRAAIDNQALLQQKPSSSHS